jgi:glycosyltransferase involved in cell wall biosynthesis
MQIAHINLARSYRGGERQTELLVRGLADSEFGQIVIARRSGSLAAKLRNVNVDLREVAGNPFSAALAAHGADIVHVHDGRSIYAAWFRHIFSATPYVVTRRVNNPIGTHWLARRVYHDAACVVGVARDIASIVSRYDPAIRCEVIHSASSGFIPDPQKVQNIRKQYAGKFLIGHVGALDNEQKGQEYIIEVARSLAGLQPTIQFLLVGGGDDESMLKEAAAGLTNLEFTGFVTNVGDYLAAFDVFILPSNKEGIGGILLDAMDQGLPIVASKVGGIHEIVHDGENGLMIDPGRPDQLQAAILELFVSPVMRKKLGQRGKEISAAYSADAMCRKYHDIYRSVIHH